ncbi:DHH family phosphoesterase [Caldimonas brevitalea]|uniref:Phosphoesterase n=1 Tax=Caldimonas brevitalea TaxID=413882 RepID=A0A0G3BLK8_9BURK|nr:DHHA1 domain-containing protein [Caldimonas brevitalea]AKJ30267.1 phosphoesterase [Caldimonas brevitalea]
MSSILTPSTPTVAPDRSDPKPLIIYHGRCPDGFAAALAAWRYYEGQAEFQGFEHGQPPPDVTGRAVYILDFSFPLEGMLQLDAQAAKLVMLDHHQSAADKLRGFKCRCGTVHFDMKKSGARLAWDYFCPGDPLPALVRYVEDRDIWKWEFPDSRPFLAALDMEAQVFERWDRIAGFDEPELQAFVERGRAMDEKFNRLAEDIAAAALPIRFNGLDGLMVNAPGAFHSEVGNLLAQRCGSFALMWNISSTGKVKVGLRSVGDFNTIPLAESMGGGGHRNATGFVMPVARLPELLSGVFDAQPSQPAAAPT